MVQWPKSKTANVVKVVLWSAVVPFAIGLTFHLGYVEILGATLVLAATYLGIRALGRRHEVETAAKLVDSERRDDAAAARSAVDASETPG
jgi:cobalamin biosynthesis protein CobD/CbiB